RAARRDVRTAARPARPAARPGRGAPAGHRTLCHRRAGHVPLSSGATAAHCPKNPLLPHLPGGVARFPAPSAPPTGTFPRHCPASPPSSENTMTQTPSPASSLASSPVSSPLGVAVIGTGTMGADHVRRLDEVISGARVAAVADPDTDRAA